MDSTPKPFDHLWQCAACGNSVKHFLGLCWNCGAARPGGEVARHASLADERAILAERWEDVLKNWSMEVLDRCQRVTERHLRRIDLARSVVLTTEDHIEGARVIRRLGTLHASAEEIHDGLATYLSDYYGEGYHGELHHAGYAEPVVFMLMYKARQLEANAVLNVTLTPPTPTPDPWLWSPYKASGQAVVVENVVT